MDGGGKMLEGARSHQIAEAVEDDVDSHTLGSFACKMLFELLANGIALPDECLEIDALPGRVYRGDHGVEQLAAVAIDLELIVADRHLRRAQMGKALQGTSQSPPTRHDEREHGDGRDLQGKERAEQDEDQPEERRPPQWPHTSSLLATLGDWVRLPVTPAPLMYTCTAVPTLHPLL